MTGPFLIILIGVAFAAATGLIVFLQIDPTCPTCRHRDWSKGVPPWRCRRCGESYKPRQAGRRRGATPRHAASAPVRAP